MGRNNQNSKFKAWQSAEPKQIIEAAKPTPKPVSEPLKVVEPEPVVEVVTETEPEVKPLVKKGKKVDEN